VYSDFAATSSSSSTRIIEPSNPSLKSPRNVLAYLPPSLFFASPSSPLPRASKHGSTIPLLLASFLPTTTIITLNYGLSSPSSHTFPLPIFETLKAFDYITSNRPPHNGGQTPRLNRRPFGDNPRPDRTNCSSLPRSLRAVVDWVSLDEIEEENKNTAVKRRSKSTPSTSPAKHSLQSSSASQRHTSTPSPHPPSSSARRAATAPAKTLTQFFLQLLALLPPKNKHSDPTTTTSRHTPPRHPTKRRSDATCFAAGHQNITEPILPPYTRVYVRDTLWR